MVSGTMHHRAGSMLLSSSPIWRRTLRSGTLRCQYWHVSRLYPKGIASQIGQPSGLFATSLPSLTALLTFSRFSPKDMEIVDGTWIVDIHPFFPSARTHYPHPLTRNTDPNPHRKHNSPLSSVVERITSNHSCKEYDEVASSILVAGICDREVGFIFCRFLL
ncbi:hypothetical protein GE09DRAFT_193452 [Coniochaeta sp. 2T2.1]|nr:hypothetical protein GE09DRAFT_193452 [Coniochaeta sp. 2T2.1]